MKDLTIEEMADKATNHLLKSIKLAEEIERRVCKQDNHDAMMKANAAIIALRQAKQAGMLAHGGEIVIKGGST